MFMFVVNILMPGAGALGIPGHLAEAFWEYMYIWLNCVEKPGYLAQALHKYISFVWNS